MAISRTTPLALDERRPWPPGFSRERFSPYSQIRRHGDLELELIPDPAKTLGDAADVVMSELVRLTVENSLVKPGSYLPKTFEQATLLVVIRRSGIPMGYSVSAILEVQGVIFLWLIATFYAKEIRGRSLSSTINRLHTGKALKLGWLRPVYLVVRTQNPLVIAGLLRSPVVYPRPDKAPPRSLQRMASLFYAQTGLSGTLDPKTLVVIAGNPRDAADPDPPRHRDPAVNAFCDAHLDYARGDLFLMLGRLHPLHYFAWFLFTALKKVHRRVLGVRS